VANTEFKPDEIQGIIVSGYAHLLYSAYLFLRFGEIGAGKQWLAEIAKETTTSQYDKSSDGSPLKPDCALNIAFTCEGVRALGYPPDSLATFAEEFRQGMVEQSRSRRLGDTGPNAPDKWEIGGTQGSQDPASAPGQIDVLLILQSKTQDELRAFCDAHKERFSRCGLIEAAPKQVGYLAPDGKEHFGFTDGISQPEIEGSPKKTKYDDAPIVAGEFLLGYKNSYGSFPPTPTVPATADPFNNLRLSADEPGARDFGENGSYLVFRKLEQDVAGFRRYFRDNFSDPTQCALMQAKFVGRWQDGTPLALSPLSPDPKLTAAPQNNRFLYADKDPQGFGCPIGSHIRRTNPRDSVRADPHGSLVSVNRHRIIRRGVSYGERLPADTYTDDGKPRGLLFFCINADIQRQFEFVQQTWVNDPKFHGLYNDPDPLIANNGARYGEPIDPSSTDSYNMTVQSYPVRTRLTGIPRFVTVRGGAYFFLPSISALYFLAGVKKHL
jgi:Dyp-type peroxidase family